MQESSQSQLFDELKNIPEKHLKNLESIFSFVKLEDKSSSKPKYFPYRLLFDEKKSVPYSDPNQDKNLDTPSLGDLANDKILPSILWKLEQYYSFVPASKDKAISLYDDLRIRTAKEIAKDMYDKNPKSGDPNPYALIKVNFSGIQKFIYTISSKGALKSLRGRSFFLELLTEHIAVEILGKLGLTKVNVVYSGGGNLYIIAPNTESTYTKTAKIIESLNDDKTGVYFQSAYKIKIYPGIESFKDDDGDVWAKVEKQISEKKHKPNISDDFFEPKEITGETCQICHHEEIEKKDINILSKDNPDIQACPFCRSIFQLGKDLIQENKYLCRTRGDSENSVKIGEYSYHLSKNLPADFDYAWIINPGCGDDDKFDHENMSHLHVADYSSGQDFGELASASVGNDLLGVLRMDVDNLGQIFQKGLGDKQKSFEYMASLSRFTGIFFKRYLNSVCNGNIENSQHKLIGNKGEKRNVSIVYAGGDDLFIVGAWNDMAELAFDIREEFRKFTGANPYITISGGLTLHKPKYPLYRMAEMAGEAEEKAKNNTRDSICLFYNPDNNGKHAYKWGEAEKILFNKEGIDKNLAGLLINDIFGNKVETNDKKKTLKTNFTTQFIYRLLMLQQEHDNNKNAKGKLALPKMAYLIGRQGERMNDEQLKLWNTKIKGHLYDVREFSQMRMVLMWMLYLIRRNN